MRDEWLNARKAICENCDTAPTEAIPHHVVYKQKVRREGGDLWDARNALSLCRKCHADHHSRKRPIFLARLPRAAHLFARELLGQAHAEDYLRRRYGA